MTKPPVNHSQDRAELIGTDYDFNALPSLDSVLGVWRERQFTRRLPTGAAPVGSADSPPIKTDARRLAAVQGEGLSGESHGGTVCPSSEDSPTKGEANPNAFAGREREDPQGEEREGRKRGPLVLTDCPAPDTRNASGDADKADSPPSAFFVKGAARRDETPVRSGAFYADDDRVAAYDGGGFVQDNYPVPRSVYAALVAVLTAALGRAPHADEARLVAHVWLVGALRYADADTFCPVPWQVLARDVPEADVDALVTGGVLDMAPHTYASEGTGRCREWAVSEGVARALDGALASAALGEPFVNLFTGRARRGRKVANRRYDDNRNPYPSPVTAAMDAIPYGIVNLPALKAHLVALASAADAAETDDGRLRARARWRNDALCLAWIESRGLTRTDVPGVYTYPHAWDMQSGGRIQPVKSGGAQSLSRAGKAACYAGVADVLNYDLRSSQPRILKAELDALGIECEWLAAYLADDAKRVYAARVGCSVDAWKAAFMAAIMGGDAGVPKAFEVKPVTRFVRGEEVTTWKPVCEAMKVLTRELGEDGARAVWPKLRGELDELLRAIGRWHRYLKAWADENATDGRGGRYVTNAVGARLNVSALSARERPRKVAAHLLQGREALFVHSLAVQGDANGFRVVSHEHDGVVALGTIPEAAIQQARDTAAMPYAEFVLKPFA